MTKNKWKVLSKKGKNFENFFVSLLARGVTDFSENLGPLQLTGTAWLQAKGNRYFLTEEINAHNDRFLDLFKNDIDLVISEYKFYQSILSDMEQASKTIAQKDFEKLDMLEYLKSWTIHFDKALQYGYDYYFLNQPAADVILEALKRNNSEDLYGDFEILSQAIELSEIQKEKADLLQIVKKKLNNEIDLEKEIQNHLNKYSGLGMYFFRGKPWQHEDIEKRIEDWLEQDIEQEILKLEKFAKADDLSRDVLAKYDFTDYEKKVVTLMKEMAYATNRYDEVHSHFIFRSQGLLHFLAEKIGLSYEELIELSIFEVYDLLENNKKADKSFRDLAIKREEDSVLLAINGKVDIFVDEKADKLIFDELGEDELVSSEKLKGVCACQGKASGKVVIFKSVKDLAKVKQGDIMVAVATVPAFVPAMERAAGIITEMGGMLSHAAIVSREMSVPCIVGVNNATKVLKSGDQVEIDATKGLIKIL